MGAGSFHSVMGAGGEQDVSVKLQLVSMLSLGAGSCPVVWSGMSCFVNFRSP